MSESCVELEPGMVRAWLSAGEPLVLIDVRQSLVGGEEGIEGCRSIPLHLLPSQLDQLPRLCRIVLYCSSGTRSRAAAQYLRETGFEAFYLRGGLTHWDQTFNCPAVY